MNQVLNVTARGSWNQQVNAEATGVSIKEEGGETIVLLVILSRSDGRPGWERRQPGNILSTLLTPITKNWHWQSMGVLRLSTANQKNVQGEMIKKFICIPVLSLIVKV